MKFASCNFLIMVSPPFLLQINPLSCRHDSKCSMLRPLFGTGSWLSQSLLSHSAVRSQRGQDTMTMTGHSWPDFHTFGDIWRQCENPWHAAGRRTSTCGALEHWLIRHDQTNSFVFLSFSDLQQRQSIECLNMFHIVSLFCG